MSNRAPESKKSDSEENAPGPREGTSRTATEELFQGFDLMFSAAKKAAKGIDAGRIEELGRRAIRTVEAIDPKQVQALGRMAAEHLDPRKIEEMAQEAKKELRGAVNRVADRVESLVGVKRSEAGSKSPTSPAGEDTAGPDPKKRIRVDG